MFYMLIALSMYYMLKANNFFNCVIDKSHKNIWATLFERGLAMWVSVSAQNIYPAAKEMWKIGYF